MPDDNIPIRVGGIVIEDPIAFMRELAGLPIKSSYSNPFLDQDGVHRFVGINELMIGDHRLTDRNVNGLYRAYLLSGVKCPEIDGLWEKIADNFPGLYEIPKQNVTRR